MNTVYQDAGVPGSALGPVVYFRKENGLPLVSCAALAARCGVSKATVHRVLKKFEQLSLVAVHHYPGKRGSVIMVQGYLSTMFSVADACPLPPPGRHWPPNWRCRRGKAPVARSSPHRPSPRPSRRRTNGPPMPFQNRMFG